MKQRMVEISVSDVILRSFTILSHLQCLESALAINLPATILSHLQCLASTSVCRNDVMFHNYRE